MPIPEEQLDTWSKQGPTPQFTATYATIKRVLEDPGSPFANRNFNIHLQGSYANDTNVYGDSDVDVVICSTDAFHYDLDHLTQRERDLFARAHPPGGLAVDTFKQEVLRWLRQQFPGAVTAGRKAICVAGNGNRRSADVLVCIEHRQFFRFNGTHDERHYKGVKFDTNGTAIVNFPKIHAENCTTKHQGTNGWYKPTVRIFKNMRNRLINTGRLADGVAPSYYIEGLLYNVPNNCFGSSYRETFVACFNWIDTSEKDKLLCANERRWLLRDGRADSWRRGDCTEFLAGVKDLWVNW